MTEPLLILLCAAIGLFWYTALRDRETALQAARRACERHELQLLDETVAVSRLRPARDSSGQLRLRRSYGFEFTRDTDHRERGQVVLLGGRVIALTLEVDGHTLHDLAS